MSELRHDPIQRRWVIIATERGLNPTHFHMDKESSSEAFCPFCEGNEDKTPKEIYAVRQPESTADGPGWRVRVLPNKFPALRIEGDLERKGVGYYDNMRGIGAHEVVVETPFHNEDWADMSVANISKIMQAYTLRIQDLCNDSRFRYILVFKNYGKGAGASLSHAHSQIIALPVTPINVAVELNSAKEHYHLKERCLFCDILQYEIQSGDRIIRMNERFVAYAPYASRFPFETWISPRYHSYDFAQSSATDLTYLAEILKDIVMRLNRSLNQPPYSFVLHNTPNIRGEKKRINWWETIRYDWHWHIELTPKITPIAGFEWGTGIYINPVAPEKAAKYLREVEI